MKVLCCVCRLPISKKHDTAVGWRWGGNGFWHPDHWTDVLPYAGKTKGRIQVDEWVTMVLRAQCHYHHHPSSFWPLWGHLTLRRKVIGSTLQMFHYSTFFNCEHGGGFCCWLAHSYRSTHLRVPGLGLSPEQLESAGVLGLDPPGWHHQIPVGLRHHHQVSPLDDSPLDALDKNTETLPMLHCWLHKIYLDVCSVSVSIPATKERKLQVNWQKMAIIYPSNKVICMEYMYLSMNYSIALIIYIFQCQTTQSINRVIGQPHIFTSSPKLLFTNLQFVAPCWWNQQHKHVDHVCNCKLWLSHTWRTTTKVWVLLSVCAHTHTHSVLPTVSTSTMSYPAPSQRTMASLVVLVTPPSVPEAGDGLINAFMSLESSVIRVLSPNREPAATQRRCSDQLIISRADSGTDSHSLRLHHSALSVNFLL